MTAGSAMPSSDMNEERERPAAEYELMLARAFDLAWDQFLIIEGQTENTAANRGSLAARIVVLGKLNAGDEVAIGDAALIFLRAVAAAKRLNVPSTPSITPEIGSAGTSLNPEAIDAATGALKACLEELPEGISAQARSILSQTILENAGKGERDGERLRALALQALKSR
jgi:hypothetical protein